MAGLRGALLAELAAKAIIDWLDDATKPTGSTDGDVTILGDLNAYAAEDPITLLVQAGFSDLGRGGYSYVFDGQVGSLDHVLTNASLTAQITGVAEWHINADEADALDYNLNLDTDATNEREPAIFDPSSPARVSDHDPLLIGIDLAETGQTVGFNQGSLQVARKEGDDGTTEIAFTIERVGGTNGSVDFVLELASTAIQTDDLVGISQLPNDISGTIADGAESASVTIKVKGDTRVEANESFTLTLKSAFLPHGGIIELLDNNRIAIGAIINDNLNSKIIEGSKRPTMLLMLSNFLLPTTRAMETMSSTVWMEKTDFTAAPGKMPCSAVPEMIS